MTTPQAMRSLTLSIDGTPITFLASGPHVTAAWHDVLRQAREALTASAGQERDEQDERHAQRVIQALCDLALADLVPQRR